MASDTLVASADHPDLRKGIGVATRVIGSKLYLQLYWNINRTLKALSISYNFSLRG